ncbi:hypothetical protein C8J56DRAFT_886778 [Mycena floridula]|nr:hypothetical protein C8J56DRAFT_886778 [Mycena floridula]
MSKVNGTETESVDGSVTPFDKRGTPEGSFGWLLVPNLLRGANPEQNPDDGLSGRVKHIQRSAPIREAPAQECGAGVDDGLAMGEEAGRARGKLPEKGRPRKTRGSKGKGRILKRRKAAEEKEKNLKRLAWAEGRRPAFSGQPVGDWKVLEKVSAAPSRPVSKSKLNRKGKKQKSAYVAPSGPRAISCVTAVRALLADKPPLGPRAYGQALVDSKRVHKTIRFQEGWGRPPMLVCGKSTVLCGAGSDAYSGKTEIPPRVIGRETGNREANRSGVLALLAHDLVISTSEKRGDHYRLERINPPSSNGVAAPDDQVVKSSKGDALVVTRE